jgi:hypothetical protein
MKRCEQDRRRVQQELSALENLVHVGTFDMRKVERELQARLTEWRDLLRRLTPIARQILGRLLDGRIAWTRHRDERRYEFTGRAKFDRLLQGIVFTEGMASPAGFEPALPA